MKFVLCSPLQGSLVDKQGRPVPGVLVERMWNWGWNGREGSDKVTTEASGSFAFPRVTRWSLTALIFPHQPIIEIRVYARLPSGPLTILSMNKLNYREEGELERSERISLNMVCRSDLEAGISAGELWGTVVELK
ncbi:MAG: hypothetical protein RL701_4293 [Pseudomonadota bacterium]|jgi:hypothetical protein